MHAQTLKDLHSTHPDRSYKHTLLSPHLPHPPPSFTNTALPGARCTHQHTCTHIHLTLYFHLASDLLLVCSRISSRSTSFCVLTTSLLGTLRTFFVA